MFVYYMIYWGLPFSVIRKIRITEFCLPKEKDNSTPNLTLIAVTIHTGNKVKSKRGREGKIHYFCKSDV